MSGRCNRCQLKAIKAIAAREGKAVTIVPAHWGMGGVDVFVHHRDISSKFIRERCMVSGSLLRVKYFKAWLMKVGDSCEC